MMSHLTRLLAWLYQSLPSRLILPLFVAVFLVGPILGAGALLVSRSSSLSALAARVSTPRSGSFSQDLQPARQPGCQGQACSGQDPIREGCVTDAVTQASVPIVYTGSAVYQMTATLSVHPGDIIGRVDRRYSPTCQAHWARTFSFGSTDAAELTLSYGPDPDLAADSSSTDPQALSLYSDMAPASQPATANIELIDLGGNEVRVSATLP